MKWPRPLWLPHQRAALQEGLRDAGRGLLQLLFPRVCWVCQKLQGPDDPPICKSCLDELITDPYFTCPHCASSVGPFVDVREGCVVCRSESFAFDRVYRLGFYKGLLRDVILRQKQPMGEGLAEIVADLFTKIIGPKLLPYRPGVVVPVPLHWAKHWQRGFNQSEVLARSLARFLEVPCQSRWLRRVRWTPMQARMQTAQARKDNVRGAFALHRSLAGTAKNGQPGQTSEAGQTIVVVDDVMTTGATLHEVARQLRKLRPARILVVVMGRGKGDVHVAGL